MIDNKASVDQDPMSRLKQLGSYPGRQVGKLYVPRGMPDIWTRHPKHWRKIYLLSDGVVPHSTFLVPKDKKYAALVAQHGFAFTHDWRDAEIIIAIRETELPHFLLAVSNNLGPRKLLLFTHEPYFSPRPSRNLRLVNRDIPVMNVFTGDVWVNPYMYCPKQKAEAMEYVAAPKALNPVIALLASHKITNISAGNLITYRNGLGIEGTRMKMVHVYGRGWPKGVSRGDTRARWKATKPAILSKYHFCLCFENTHAENYVTEKIWDSIVNYCLPVYMGSPWIYKIFPKDSFIDYETLGTPTKLFEFVFAMTPEEWARRLNLCIDVFKKATEQPDSLLPMYDNLFKRLRKLLQ
jgi:hypothetical protein